jgi:hypothetical protein
LLPLGHVLTEPIGDACAIGEEIDAEHSHQDHIQNRADQASQQRDDAPREALDACDELIACRNNLIRRDAK